VIKVSSSILQLLLVRFSEVLELLIIYHLSKSFYIRGQLQFQLHHNCNGESSMCQEYRFALQLWSQLKTDKAICSCNKNKEKLTKVNLQHLNHFPKNIPLKSVLAHQLLHQLLIDKVWALIKYQQLDQTRASRRKTKQNIEPLREPKTNLNLRQTGVVCL
jgi:hypothetical protein